MHNPVDIHTAEEQIVRCLDEVFQSYGCLSFDVKINVQVSASDFYGQKQHHCSPISLGSCLENGAVNMDTVTDKVTPLIGRILRDREAEKEENEKTQEYISQVRTQLNEQKAQAQHRA